MKELSKIWLPAIIIAVAGLWVMYQGDLEIKGLQAQLDVIANHEHDMFHEHDISHVHDYDDQIRSMLELLFELEDKVNAK